MEKALLKSYDDFQYLIAETIGIYEFCGRIVTWLDRDDDNRPRKYPCVAVWDIVDDDNGPAELVAYFVYLDDFVDLSDFVNLDNFNEEDEQEEEEEDDTRG